MEHAVHAKRLVGADYKLLHSLGEGAYGTVVAALHRPSGRQVAIKKVLPFEHTLFCLRTLRELKLLRFFSDTCQNENVSAVCRVSHCRRADVVVKIISILSIIKPESLDSFKEIYCTRLALPFGNNGLTLAQSFKNSCRQTCTGSFARRN